jgi:hypothetical protein
MRDFKIRKKLQMEANVQLQFSQIHNQEWMKCCTTLRWDGC